MPGRKNILITGAKGLLGSSFPTSRDDCNFIKRSESELDITDSEMLERKIEEIKPDWIFHFAALTDLDFCEKNSKKAYEVNTRGTENICNAIRDRDCQLLFTSTNMIFGGDKTTPYTEDDTPDPLNVYGKSKLKAEGRIQTILPEDQYIITRILWLFGERGNDFVSRLPFLIKEEQKLKVEAIIEGAVTYTKHLVDIILALLERSFRGIVNVSNKGKCTIYEVAKEIAEVLGVNQDRLTKVGWRDLDYVAPRPKMQALSLERLKNNVGIIPPSWENGVRDYLKDLSLI